MTLKSQIYPGSIGFFLIWLQNFKTCSTLNTIKLQKMDYLASNLSPEECFQLYNLLDHRHVNRVETLRYINKRNQAIPCINLLATWWTDPDELNYKSLDRVALKLAKIGRKDLALQLEQVSGVEELDPTSSKRIIHEVVLGDERLQRSTCSTRTSGRMQFFWKVLFVALIILIFFFCCVCCCRFIFGKLRCICSRIVCNQCREKDEQEEYCLCTDQYKPTSLEYFGANGKKFSPFRKAISKFQNYFENREERKERKRRSKKFQKLKTKLQEMYLNEQKKVKVNRQEERILNSLTEEERDELGEIIREMKFLLDSDKETEKLLISGKHQGTFIIDMKNLHQPKITRSCDSRQEIKTIKKWESKDRMSSSLSEEMVVSCSSGTRKQSGSETKRSNREKKKSSGPNATRRKSSKHHFETKSPGCTATKEIQIPAKYELDVKSEFVKCYGISDSDKNCSSPIAWGNNRRCSLESERESNFSTSEETDLSTFRSDAQFDNSQNLSPTLTRSKEGIQSDIGEDRTNFLNVMKSQSAIELGSKKSIFDSRIRSQKERTQEKNHGDHSESYKSKQPSDGKKKVYINSSRTSFVSSSWSATPRYSKKNPEKSKEYSLFKNSDHGDTESQLDLCETYDELGFLFSLRMKQQSRPCYRKYCLLRRHLRQRAHDQRQCRLKQNYFQYYPNGQAPSCSSGNICRDTYDELNLMRATPEERRKIRQAVYERRKEFLDQPCVSPGRHISQIYSG